MSQEPSYPIPTESKWPILGAISLFILAIGAINWVHGDYSMGHYFVGMGALILAVMLFGFFREVIREGHQAKGDPTAENFRFQLGMFWFIFSEFMFFFIFFFALFYARLISVPELSGVTSPTHLLLWPNFQDLWPVMQTPDPSLFVGPKSLENPWHVPLLNTILLFLSDVVLTLAYISIRRGKHTRMIVGMLSALILAIGFLYFQVYEFGQAYTVEGIMLKSGIYGATFIALTGIHAVHIAVGCIMLFVIMLRGMRGEFDKDNHFAVGAVSWYWHFLDALWFALFIFVYWL